MNSMDKRMIEQMFRHNKSDVLAKSILDCHVKGLHSIVLDASTSRLMRMFMAMPGCELQTNSPGDRGSKMTLAYHPHVCDIDIHVVHGRIRHYTKIKNPDGATLLANLDRLGPTVQLDEYVYESAIRGKKDSFSFTPTGRKEEFVQKIDVLREGETLCLKANDVHTVGTFHGERAAWVIVEGEEDADYKSYSWSDTRIDQAPRRSDLYRRPTDFDEILEVWRTFARA